MADTATVPAGRYAGEAALPGSPGAPPRGVHGRAVDAADRPRRALADHLRDLALAARVLLLEAGLSRWASAGRVRQLHRRARRAREFWDATRITFVFTIASVVLETLIGLAMAMAMHSAFKGQGILRTVVLVPWAVLTVVTAIMWQTIFDPNLGFVNQLLGTEHGLARGGATGADGDDLRRRLEDGAVHGAAAARRVAGDTRRDLRGGARSTARRRGSASGGSRCRC